MKMLIEKALEEYKVLSEQEKIIGARKKELSNFIKEYAQENGVKDDKGSFYAENDFFVYGSQAKKSVKLNFDRAKQFLISKGLWKEVVKYEEIIDEDKVASLVEEEKITFDELEEVTDVKVSYAVTVKAKEQAEDMPEVKTFEKELKPRVKLLKSK